MVHENVTGQAARRIAVALLSGLLLLGARETAAQTDAGAQTEETQAFLGLTLEELMRTDIQEINVLGTYAHLASEWMMGYKFMPMQMAGLRDGTTRRTVEEVLRQFMVAPTGMQMDMHMLDVMYAPWDDLTLMGMVPYLELSMDHRTRMGTTFSTRTAGIGDVSLTALYTAVGNVRRDRQRLIIRGGVSLPTGSIDERGDTPAGSDQKLPYPMQLGSGTYDLHPGLSYLSESDRWAWTLETQATLRLGTNDSGYRLGHQWRLGASANRRWTQWMSPLVRVEADVWGNIDGADPELNPMMVPTANPTLRGGNRVVVCTGLEFYVTDGRLKQNRFAVEVSFPVRQSLQGPQLETGLTLRSGWSWTF